MEFIINILFLLISAFILVYAIFYSRDVGKAGIKHMIKVPQKLSYLLKFNIYASGFLAISFVVTLLIVVIR